jgi:hypothetical protein
MPGRSGPWDQREELRAAYEAVHGTDPYQWPDRHPGIVIDAVEWVAQPGSSLRRGYEPTRPARADARSAACVCSAAVTTTASEPGYTVAS